MPVPHDRSRRPLVALALVAALMTAGCGSRADPSARSDAAAASSDRREVAARTHGERVAALQDVCRWAPVFGGYDPTKIKGFDLAVVDAVAQVDGSVDADADHVADLHRRGTLVIAYLSVGTVENWRHYASGIPRSDTLADVDGWDGERYADPRSPRWVAAMVAEAKTLADAGFDGLYLDNLDVAEEFPETADAMVGLVTALRTAAPDLLLIAQNGLAIDERLPVDAVSHEDVYWRWDDDRYVATPASETEALLAGLRRIKAKGLPVFTLDYTEPGHPAAPELLQRSLDEGFRPAVTVLDLGQPPHLTPGCPRSTT